MAERKKSNRISTIVGALLGTVLALLFTSFAHAQVSEEFHQTYPLAANGTFSIGNLNGFVHITAWDQNQVKVDAVKRGETKQKLDDARIEVDASADRVSIRTRYPEHDSWFRGYDNPASVDYTISVPRGVRLEAHLVNGPLELSGVTGEVRASAVNASMSIKGLASEAELSTVNSRLEAEFDRLPNSGRISAKSVNGSVTVSIPSNANVEVEANTLNGGIHNDFNLPVQNGRPVGHKMRGKIGDGGLEITMHNVNGRVDLRHNDDGKPLSTATSTLPEDRGRLEPPPTPMPPTPPRT